MYHLLLFLHLRLVNQPTTTSVTLCHEMLDPHDPHIHTHSKATAGISDGQADCETHLSNNTRIVTHTKLQNKNAISDTPIRSMPTYEAQLLGNVVFAFLAIHVVTNGMSGLVF